jgi:hypothetical protein
MATKDISDKQVVEAFLVCGAYNTANPVEHWVNPQEALSARTGQPLKVCRAAIDRAFNRGYIDYGVSLLRGWVTEKGKELLK